MKGFDDKFFAEHRRQGLRVIEGAARPGLAFSASNVEPHTVVEAARPNAIKVFDSPVRVHVHSIRGKMADPDGISIKAMLDGLVLEGLLANDRTEEVAAVSFGQSKGSPERTIVTLTPV